MTRGLWTVAALVAVPMAAGIAQADIVQFSGALSDDDAPADVFDARVEYTYLDLDQVLCVTIWNDTAAPDPYTISSLYFNTSDDVTGLALITDELSPFYNADFVNATLASSEAADGFGVFDWHLDLDSTGNDGVLAGGSSTFYFDVSGANITIDDFFSHNQQVANPNKPLGVAALHLTRGPEDDSVFSLPGTNGEPPPPITVIPEPASLALLGLGLLGMGLRRRFWQ